MFTIKRVYLERLAMLCVIVHSIAHSQSEPVRLSGSIQLSTEAYSSSGVAARKEKNSSRAIIRPTLTLFDQVVLPFEVYVTSEDRGFRQPFNQFGVSPQLFGWLTLHGGYFSSQVSEFTFGDTRMLGGGIEMRPGKFRLMALYGRIQDSANPDSAQGFPGVYSRTAFAGKIGYGADDGFHIDLNVMRAVDDSTSVQNSSISLAPSENLVTSLAFGFPLFDGLMSFSSEVGVSAYSSDIRSREIDEGPTSLKSLFTPRTSSQVDGAVTAGVQFTFSPAFSLGLQTRWIGPGYVTLGYAQLPNDVLDVTLSPSIRVAENRLQLRSSMGVRFNNLRQNRLATTRRTILNLGISYQANDAMGVDLQYANYGIRSTPRNDTLRIDNVTQSLSIAPRVVFDWLDGSNFATVSYSLQDFTDKNVITSALSKNTSQSIATTWSLSLPSSLSFTTNYTATQSRTSVLTLKIHSITETLGYSLFDNTLTLSLTGGYNIVRGMSSDGQVTANFSAAYTLGNAGTITLIIMGNRYNFENSLAGSSFLETQGSLLYSYSF
jgi:hypothetical protein